MMSKINKTIEIIELKELESYLNKGYFEIYIEKNLKIVAKNWKLEVIKLDEKSKKLKIVKIRKDELLPNTLTTMKLIRNECEKFKIDFKTFVNLAIEDNILMSTTEKLQLEIEEIGTNKVFNPFKKYEKAVLTKTKMNKIDLLKILKNKQFKKCNCDGHYTDDYYQDYLDNLKTGIVGYMYIMKEIIENNKKVSYCEKDKKFIVGEHWLSYSVEL